MFYCMSSKENCTTPWIFLYLGRSWRTSTMGTTDWLATFHCNIADICYNNFMIKQCVKMFPHDNTTSLRIYIKKNPLCLHMTPHNIMWTSPHNGWHKPYMWLYVDRCNSMIWHLRCPPQNRSPEDSTYMSVNSGKSAWSTLQHGINWLVAC